MIINELIYSITSKLTTTEVLSLEHQQIRIDALHRYFMNGVPRLASFPEVARLFNLKSIGCPWIKGSIGGMVKRIKPIIRKKEPLPDVCFLTPEYRGGPRTLDSQEPKISEERKTIPRALFPMNTNGWWPESVKLFFNENESSSVRRGWSDNHPRGISPLANENSTPSLFGNAPKRHVYPRKRRRSCLTEWHWPQPDSLPGQGPVSSVIIIRIIRFICGPGR